MSSPSKERAGTGIGHLEVLQRDASGEDTVDCGENGGRAGGDTDGRRATKRHQVVSSSITGCAIS